MKIVSLDNGKTYLAEGVTGGKVVGACEVGEFSKSSLIKYMKTANLGELIDIEISEATGFNVTDLTADQKREVKRLDEIFKEAEEKAQKYTVNSIFEKLVKKYE